VVALYENGNKHADSKRKRQKLFPAYRLSATQKVSAQQNWSITHLIKLNSLFWSLNQQANEQLLKL
jgi:hypothetical protein